MSKALKYKLPAYSEICHLSLSESELNSLRMCVDDLKSDFKTTLNANPILCSIHAALVKDTYDSMLQINLTDSVVKFDRSNDDSSLYQCTTLNASYYESGKINAERLKRSLTTNSDSVLNEHTYTTKTEHFNKHGEIFNNIMKKFKGMPTRIRLVKLLAGSSITPHIDYDPSYATRIIIPIIADSECVNLFWVKNTVIAANFKNGSAYFLNTGFKHAVTNYSNHDRYTLMISVNGTEDIQDLLSN